MAKNATNPVGEVQGTAPVGAAPKEEQLEKIISDDLIEQLKAQSLSLGGNLIGKGLKGAAAGMKANGTGKTFFDPSLSQYKEGLVLFFDEENCDVKEIPVGRDGSTTATVVICPAGLRQPDGSVNFNRVFNAYISTFRKSINVTDENGEPVLNEKKEQITITGNKNIIWNEMQKYKDEPSLLNALSGRKFVVSQILHDFGPSNYVGETGNRRPTGHRLTALPLFEEI